MSGACLPVSIPVTTGSSLLFQGSHLTFLGLPQAHPGEAAILALQNQGRLPGASSTHTPESSPACCQIGEVDIWTGTCLAPAGSSSRSTTVLGKWPP